MAFFIDDEGQRSRIAGELPGESLLTGTDGVSSVYFVGRRGVGHPVHLQGGDQLPQILEAPVLGAELSQPHSLPLFIDGPPVTTRVWEPGPWAPCWMLCSPAVIWGAAPAPGSSVPTCTGVRASRVCVA